MFSSGTECSYTTCVKVACLLKVSRIRYTNKTRPSNTNFLFVAVSWDKRGPFSYYIELGFDVATLSIDLSHHLHMLLWSNIYLSMASLVIVMHLRYLTHEIQRKFKKHRNYLWVLNHMEKTYPLATLEDLSQNSDNCAICWEKMETARKLPCAHLFHK